MIVRSVGAGQGSGASALVDYIEDRDKEPDRCLFTEAEDRVTAREADLHLTRGEAEKPRKHELIHVIVSPSRDEWERLGSTDDERAEGLRVAVREGMAELARKLGVEDARYVAGVHRNTDDPHAHIALSDRATDARTGAETRIAGIPRTLLPPTGAREKAPGAEDKPRTVVDMFRDAVDRHGAPASRVAFDVPYRKEPLWREVKEVSGRDVRREERLVARWILAELGRTDGETREQAHERRALTQQVRALDEAADARRTPRPAAAFTRDEIKSIRNARAASILYENGAADLKPAHEKLLSGVVAERTDPDYAALVLGKELALTLEQKHLAHELERTREQGEIRRYEVTDPSHGLTRRMSVHDIEQRSRARAYREVSRSPAASPAERQSTVEAGFARDRAGHQRALDEIRAQHASQVRNLESKLSKVTLSLIAVSRSADGVRSELKASGKEPPTPRIDGRVLDELQEQAFTRRDLAQYKQVEDLRATLVREGKCPVRTPEQLSRLLGHATVASSDSRVADRRVEEFRRSAHTRDYPVDGRRLSLAAIDKRAGQTVREIAFQTRLAEGYDRRRHAQAASLRSFSWRGEELDAKRETALARAAALREEAARLPTGRETVLAALDADRERLHAERDRSKAFATSIGAIADAERARLRAALEQPAPRLEEWEARRLENNAAVTRDGATLRLADRALEVARSPARDEPRAERAPATYRTLSGKERELISALDRRAGLADQPQSHEPSRRPASSASDVSTAHAARCLGRAVAAGVEWSRAQDRLESWERHKAVIPVPYLDTDGVLRTAALKDAEAPGLLERLRRAVEGERAVPARPPAGAETGQMSLMERLRLVVSEPEDERARRALIRGAVAEHEAGLRREAAETHAYYREARDIANEHLSEIRAHGRPEPSPLYTAREIAKIEAYGSGVDDDREHKSYTSLVSAALLEGRVTETAEFRRDDRDTDSHSQTRELAPPDPLARLAEHHAPSPQESRQVDHSEQAREIGFDR